ncbi:hypothetical protein SCHPADRAFT_169098 [Schizopora paradoxa]|uniref:Arrestin-like N-terminal domain-containing protein n=1 Tax=Schizopora paradoxa TaxID=27342 RepID=A0A0H2RZD5_9AGAM|nr:hypothetical protein SCHPADRAFT_169098 [Schizopora paradoxa]
METFGFSQKSETTGTLSGLSYYTMPPDNIVSSDAESPIDIASKRRILVRSVTTPNLRNQKTASSEIVHRGKRVAQSVRSASTTRRVTETVTTLDDKSKTPWLSLILVSGPYSTSLPSFTEGEAIQGRVVIDLAKPQSIDSIFITVKGMIYCNLYETTKFYSESKIVWKAEANEPPAPNLTTFRRKKSKSKSDAKLEGRHVWPFSFTIPHEFAVKKAVAREFKLRPTELMPPTLDGKTGNSSIYYQFVVDVKRKGFLQADATLSSRFEYIPMSKPGAVSVLRNEAYLTESEPLGPADDVEGWSALDSYEVVRGLLFQNRLVSVKYSFALATPLSYTRGSIIPCFLTILSDDPQALQLFSNPLSPVVYLRRKLKYKSSRNDMNGGLSYVAGWSELIEKVPLSVGVWKVARSKTDESDPQSRRYLYGELSLPSNLVPSFTFGPIEVKSILSTSLVSPQSPGFGSFAQK